APGPARYRSSRDRVELGRPRAAHRAVGVASRRRPLCRPAARRQRRARAPAGADQGDDVRRRDHRAGVLARGAAVHDRPPPRRHRLTSRGKVLGLSTMEALNLRELEALARARLPQMTWDYYASGADDESCLRRNCEAFEQLALHYRVLVDAAHRDPATTVLGQRASMPILVAPTAFHRLAHEDGELASVRGAGDAGTIFILSTLSNTAVEEVV